MSTVIDKIPQRAPVDATSALGADCQRPVLSIATLPFFSGDVIICRERQEEYLAN